MRYFTQVGHLTSSAVSAPAENAPALLSAADGSASITFDTTINRHSRRALYRYPDCVKRYELLIPQGSGWQRIAGEDDNYMRRRELRFAPVTTDRVRLAIHEANGAGVARVYEVRLYDMSA